MVSLLAVFTVPTDWVDLLFCKLDLTYWRHLLMYSGCVVFGRVAGDSASSYLFSELTNGRAANRLATVASHVLESGQGQTPAESEPAKKGDRTAAQLENEKLPPTQAKEEGKAGGEFTKEEVAKHNKPDDCWVIIDGQVLDVTK